MKILLAGATGAVGRLLVPLLIEAGHEVVGTTRSASKSAQISALGARPAIANALDRPTIFALLAEERPDVVIHQLTDLADRDFGANSRLREEGSRNLVDAAQAIGVQRMIAQSIGWMYVPGNGPASEEEALDLDAPPARKSGVDSVHMMESAVAEMPTGIILRYGLFYGPATWYYRKAETKEGTKEEAEEGTEGFTTDQVRRGELTAPDAINSFIHVADAAAAALLALNWPAGAYNIVDDEPALARDWIPYYAKLVGAPPPPYQPGKQEWERGASNAKARALGWRPHYSSWREGFKEVLG